MSLVGNRCRRLVRTTRKCLTRLGRIYLRMEKLEVLRFLWKMPPAASLGTDETTDFRTDNIKLAVLQAQNRAGRRRAVADFEALARSDGNSSRSGTIALMRTHLANGDIEKAKGVTD